MDTIMKMESVSKQFPGVLALDQVDFDLRKGEIHGLVGHNGAGKSTLMKVLTGTYIPEEGQISLNGEPIILQSPRDAIQKGIGIVTQEGSLIPSFTGIQNIFLGQEEHTATYIHEDRLLVKAEKLMKYFGMSVPVTKNVEDLNPAQRKLIEILKVLNQNPKVLILDEPTAALSEKERVHLFEVMKRLKEENIGIVFITHYLEEVQEMSDRITVLRNGRHAGVLQAEEATKDRIVQLMINREQKSEYPQRSGMIGECLFETKNISDGEVCNNMNVKVHRGEIVGMFGSVGSGRTEFVETVFGARMKTSGEVLLEGQAVQINKVADAIHHGFALIPDDRLTKALFLDESVKDNITIPYLKELSQLFRISFLKEQKNAKKMVEQLSIKTPTIHTKVSSLSGGNKQKVSFAKWIGSDQEKAKVFMFDEPTEGVDVGAREEMYKIISGLTEQGAGCLVVSSDISEILGLSDRIYVMREGEIALEVKNDRSEHIHQKLMEASLGI